MESTSTTNELNYTINMFYGSLIHDLKQTRNSRRENLLHYACKLNKSRQIESFINIGCSLCQQDIQGRTPLHIVIEMQHTEALDIFSKLFKQKYLEGKNKIRNKRLTEDLKKLFRIYDHQGYTVLHRAVLNNMTQLVEDMLRFCLKHNINVADSEVLGCGDSILHLAVKRNLIDMAKLIYEYIPKFLNVSNYGGKNPSDYESITLEMKMVLQMNIKCLGQYYM